MQSCQSVAPKEVRQLGLMVGSVFGVNGLWLLLVRGEPFRWLAIGR